MKTRTDLLNFLAKKYNIYSYLEIGVQNAEQNFDKIICPHKVGVDPNPDIFSDTGDIYPVTSDFFLDSLAGDLGYNDNQFGLIFIDGLHTAEQVKKDFEGCLKYLKPNGFIVLHDCNPEKEEHTIVPRPTKTGHWNGDVYKFAALLRVMSDNDEYFTVDIDNGCGVFLNINNRKFEFDADFTIGNWWGDFTSNRNTNLNLITWDEFVKLHES
jgi:hypothetical protein